MNVVPRRLTYEETCSLLRREGFFEEDDPLPLPAAMPQYDDEVLGVHFFKTCLGEGDLENLTLRRTYFARSEVGPMSFKNTDLAESSLCWNDFIEVDFTDCDLSNCDVRASIFTDCLFVRADLRNSDLRRSTFDACVFTDAVMRGAKLTFDQGTDLELSDKQRKEIDWQDKDGDEPNGG